MSDHDDKDDASDAEFASGFGGVDKPAGKTTPARPRPEPAADEPRQQEEAAPEYVQVTRAELDEMKAAAARTESYDSQFKKAFGTIGRVKQLVDELRTQTPRDLEVKMPDEAFKRMEKDYPELAQLSREEFQKVLANLRAVGNNKPDPETIKSTLVELEVEDLTDAYPDWKEIVGAVSADEQPDPENPFRKWLSGKDQAYQDRINGTIRAPVIQRAIRLFQNETKAQQQKAVAPKPDQRAERMKAAVQPRGDGGVSMPRTEDDFEMGFKNARN